MNKYTLKYFGEIDIGQLEEYYDLDMDLNGKSIEVDLTIEDKIIDVAKLNLINDWLSDIQQLDRLGLAAINDDFKTGDTVKEYIQHHLEELDGDDIKDLLKTSKGGGNKDDKLLSIIRLKRIGFYPNTEERFISLDYTLDEDLTDYLIVLDFNKDGNLQYITTES